MAQVTVVQQENVRYDYGQVLRAEPVYQTLRATSMEQQCDDDDAGKSGLSKIVGKVKDVLGGGKRESGATRDSGSGDCRVVPVQHEYRRPIAYDVDYVYKGMRYRSRLPFDPGNRIKLRVSITPYVPPAR